LAAFCCCGCCWHCMSQVNYSSCSDEVMRVMAADTMRSSKHLVEDIVGVLPVLLYQVRSSSLSRPVSQHTAAQGLSDHRLLCVAGSTSGCDCLLPVGVKGARHYLHWSAAQAHTAVDPAMIPSWLKLSCCDLPSVCLTGIILCRGSLMCRMVLSAAAAGSLPWTGSTAGTSRSWLGRFGRWMDNLQAGDATYPC